MSYHHVQKGLLLIPLKVTVSGGQVRAAFGWGWPCRTVDLVDVVNARQVRNSWISGWGIRKVRCGWMYNIWGLDAVELTLCSGRVFRIGTDDPEGLLQALDSQRTGNG